MDPAHGDDELRDGERLQRVLARVGIGSRRVCDDLIADGRVKVNGRRAIPGARVDATADLIEVDGSAISVLPDTVTYLLNKPKGVMVTADDPEGRPIVLDLVPVEPRVFSVGRLDFDTEGLLLLTNDGTLAHRLTHPSFGVEKEYLAHVSGQPTRHTMRRLREGVELDDGVTAPAQASEVSPGLIRLVIHEGRNRQVRRMCEAVGHPVQRLVRTRIGPITDTRLKPGEFRVLDQRELLALQRAVGPVRPTESPR